MKNYLMEGDTITLTAPYAVVSGDGLLVGSIFGVACGDAAINADVESLIEGAFTLKKAAAQAWTQGVLIYWDNAAKNCTTTLTSNKLIGVAITAALSADTVGNVRLNSAFISEL
jgi:predicted RecA/RadA family phage recombinase